MFLSNFPFKALFELFTNETTMHGIGQYDQRKSWIWRLFWVLGTLASSGIVIYYGYFIFVRYLSHPTATNLAIASRDKMLLPNFGFCTDNLMSLSMLNRYNVSENLRKVFNSFVLKKTPNVMFMHETHPIPPEIPEHVWEETRIEYDQLLKTVGVSNFDGFLALFLLRCNEVVIGCTLNNQPFDCCKDALHRFVAAYSLCYILGTGHQESPTAGLGLFLNYPPLDVVNFVYPQKGVHASLVHDPIKMNDEFTHVHLPVGKIADIFVEVMSIDAVNNPPKYICKDDPKYSRLACTRACGKASETGGQNNTCNCRHPFSNEGLTDICDPWTMRKCPVIALDPIKYGKCIEDNCALSCKSTKISHRMQISEFNVKTAAIGWNMSEIDAAAKLADSLMVTVQYNALEETVTEQHFSLTFGDVLSDVGGLFGLFIGASLLTFVHVAVFILEAGLTRAMNTEKLEN